MVGRERWRREPLICNRLVTLCAVALSVPSAAAEPLSPPAPRVTLATVDKPSASTPQTPVDAVAFVLTMSGGLQPGATRAPPQRLLVPVDLLDKPVRMTEGSGVIRAGEVSLRVPGEQSSPALHASISITAAGWQERSRNLADPDRGAYPNYSKSAPDASGLRAIVSEDPSRYDNPYESVYLAEDAEIGFVHVKCMGFPQRGPRGCRITSELSSYITVSIYLRENALAEWRSGMLAARTLVRMLLV
jgi:hypothetical protein